MTRLKIEISVPDDHVAAILAALESAGAGQVGNYDRCTSMWRVGGTWKPGPGSEPYDGEIDTLMYGTETRVESECEADLAQGVLDAVREAHPHEEPGIRFIPLYEPARRVRRTHPSD